MAKYINFKMTRYEAIQLFHAASNGFGDGEFFVNPDGTDSGHGGQRACNSFEHVHERLRAALFDKRGN